MSKKILLSVACLLLCVGMALAGEAVQAPPALVAAATGPACGADAAATALTGLGFQPVYRDHDPATCGRCLNCASTNVCAGKLLGDVCSINGGTCQAFDGCALYNCCRCANVQPAGGAAAERSK